MSLKHPKMLFDDQDFELVQLVNEFIGKGKKKQSERLSKLFDPYLHPRGIKELAAAQQLRIAYAVIRLLDTLEEGHASERLEAMRVLRDEVLHNASGTMRRNTARVLIEIMKRLVREHGNYWRQVRLAHDFFMAVHGRPTVIRKELAKYRLVEMSEDWTQMAFDHHVHDANTKGRKSPTHLIMDAWIKGIRNLFVVYYNFVRPEAMDELLEAAEIMGIDVTAGVEFKTVFRGKYVRLMWTPRGLETRQHVRDFLAEPVVRDLMAEGHEASAYASGYVLDLLHAFNANHLPKLVEAYGVEFPPIDQRELLEFVGVGQPSVEHLAELIHMHLLPHLKRRVEILQQRFAEASESEAKQLGEEVERLNGLMPDRIREDYLSVEANPELTDPDVPRDGDSVPELLTYTPGEIVERLRAVHTGFSLTLNTSNINPADLLELLHICKGAITHIEIFNLKDYKTSPNPDRDRLANIRRLVNDGSPVACKRMIETVVKDLERGSDPEKDSRIACLREILRDLPAFLSVYSQSRLKSRIGSDSFGRSRRTYGMGLVVRETLPHRSQRRLEDESETRETIPVRTEAFLESRWIPRHSHLPPVNAWYRLLRRVPGLREFGYKREDDYVVGENVTRPSEDGNIVTLGGLEEDANNGFTLDVKPAEDIVRFRWHYLNSYWKDLLKVVIGFIPAFLTFYLTKDWWLLAYFGAPIWFGITGVRNVIQSIVGGGGLRRSKLLRWNDLVSWGRVSDSLLFTGFSVPLLDWLVKGVILDEGAGITTSTNPNLLYTIMALANGIYLFSHNTFRGLPRAAAFGNFFRSVLSIPIAIGFNAALLRVLVAAGMSVADANAQLQLWAAVIAKAASDTVAGFIEGAADRNINVRIRFADYKTKLRQILEIHGQLEILFPDKNVAEMLESPKRLIKKMGADTEILRRQLIINALDMMYFWMFQPRARMVLRSKLRKATPDEREIVLRTQGLLERTRPISEMFLDDLVGKEFVKPLAFYLDKSPHYLADMRRLRKSLASD